jgi:hypothetical protein
VQTKLEAGEAVLPELSTASRAHVAAAARMYRGEALPDDADVLRSGAACFYGEIRALADAAIRR